MSPRWFLVGEVHSCFRRWSVRRSWGSSWLGAFCPSKVYEYCAFATAEKLRQVTSNIIIHYSEKEKDLHVSSFFYFGQVFLLSWTIELRLKQLRKGSRPWKPSEAVATRMLRLMQFVWLTPQFPGISWKCCEAAKLVRFYWDICVSQMSQSSQRSWRASWVEKSILEHKIWQKRSLPSFERRGSATIRRSIRLITTILQSYTVLYCQYVRSMKNRSDREHDSSVHLNFTLIISLKFFSSL